MIEYFMCFFVSLFQHSIDNDQKLKHVLKKHVTEIRIFV